jgi:uncharacterized protein
MTQKLRRIIELLELKPLDMEGGYYRETYRSADTIPKSCLPDRYGSPKSFSTAIYYLITPTTFSSLHKLPTDEVFHFYLGDPVEMLQLFEDGTGRIVKIGSDIENGCSLQVVVPKHTWQGSRLVAGGEFALMGTTMAPGFDFEDFVAPDKNELMRRYPEFSAMIQEL